MSLLAALERIGRAGQRSSLQKFLSERRDKANERKKKAFEKSVITKRENKLAKAKIQMLLRGPGRGGFLSIIKNRKR